MTTRRHLLGPLVAIGVLTLCGCPETPPDARDVQPAETPATDAAEPNAADSVSETPQLPPREDTAGLWRLTIVDQGTEVPAFLMRVDGESVEFVEASPQLEGLELVSSEATSESVRAEFKLVPPNADGEEANGEESAADDDAEAGDETPGELRQELELRFVDGRLLGSFDFGPAGRSFAVAEATDAEGLGDPTPSTTESAKQFQSALQASQGADLKIVREFLSGLDNDPVGYLGWLRVMQLDMRLPVDVDQLKSDAETLAEEAAVWGPKYEQDAAMQTLITFSTREEVPPEVARERLEVARETLGEEKAEELSDMLLLARTFIDVRDSDVAVEEARESIEGLRDRLPPSDMLLELQARDAKRRGDVEGELRAVTEMSVIPNGLENMQRVGELYQKARGDVDGIEGYLSEVYREAITWYAKDAETVEVGRPVLVEMFTGQSCAPCVAADTAISALSDVAPEVTVLRYHVDVPGPDPLATSVGRERFRSYGVRGAPAVAVDGLLLSSLGGPFDAAPTSFATLVSTLEARPKTEPVDVQVQATRKGDKLSIEAAASGLPGEGDVRLLVAVATDRLFLKADNGILLHEMVVRDMPGGPDGVPASDGAAELKTNLDLLESRNQLIAGMQVPFDRVPEEFRQSIITYGDLTVVAFVQDVATKEVLGTATAVAPLPQDDSAEDSPAEEKDPAAEPSDAEQDTENEPSESPAVTEKEVEAGKSNDD